MTRIFYRGAHCVFLTYDVTREDTFANLSQWLSEVKQHATEDVRIYMVGNKSEMEEQREVTYERAVEMARAQKIHRVFETSAKTGYNVEELFASVAKELYAQAKKEMEQPVKAPVVENPVVSLETTGKGGNNGRRVEKKKGVCC